MKLRFELPRNRTQFPKKELMAFKESRQPATLQSQNFGQSSIHYGTQSQQVIQYQSPTQAVLPQQLFIVPIKSQHFGVDFHSTKELAYKNNVSQQNWYKTDRQDVPQSSKYKHKSMLHSESYTLSYKFFKPQDEETLSILMQPYVSQAS